MSFAESKSNPKGDLPHHARETRLQQAPHMRPVALAASLFAVFFFSAARLNVGAADVSSLWLGNTGNWSVPANWSPSSNYPNNGNGGLTYDATVDSGLAILTEDITIQAFNLLGGTVTGNFNLTANSLVTWSGGTLSGAGILSALAGMDIGGSINGTVYQHTRTILNAGTTVLIGRSEHNMDSAAIFNNVGTYDVQGDGAIGSRLAGGSFNNSGTFRKSGGTGYSYVWVPFNNSGTVQSQSGILAFSGGGPIAGTYDTSGGGKVDFAGGTFTLDPGANFIGGGARLNDGGTLSLSGPVNLNGIGLIGGTVEGTFTPAGSFNLAGADLTGTVDPSVPFNWSAGAIRGAGVQAISAGNTLTISGGVTQFMRTLANAGMTILTGENLHEFNNAVFNNSGTYDIQNDGHIWNGSGVDGSPAFNNSGTFKKSGGSGTSRVEVPFSNTGTVEVQSGTLHFASTYSQTAGTTFLNGGKIDNFDIINILGGTLAGSGWVIGNVRSSGTIAPGTSPASIGTLKFGENLQLESTGHISFELGGTTPGSGYDLVTGYTFYLGGNLDVKFINGFEHSVRSTDTFIIMDAAHLGNSFDNVASGERLETTEGVGSFLVTYGSGPSPLKVVLSDFQPASGPGKLSQTISFDPIPDKMLGDEPFAISASASSGLPVSFRIVSGPATISGNIITLTGTGTVIVRATQAGNATYAPAPDVERSFTARLKVGAADVNSLWLGNTGNWSDPANWSPSSNYPNNGNGGLTYDATVGSGSATLTEDITIQAFNMLGGTVTGNFNLTANSLVIWSGGTLSGAGILTINPGNTLIISGTRVLQDRRTIANAGTTVLAGSAWHYLGNGAVFNNTGTYDIQNNGHILASGGSAAFNNSGTFRKSGDAGSAVFVPFSNTGTVEVQSSGLNFSTTYSQTAGTTLLNGGSIEVHDMINILGGTLKGFGNVSAYVVNVGAGTIAPGAMDGSAGGLRFDGSLSLSSGAHMSFELGGTTQGSQYDSITVAVALTLGGNLDIRFINGFEQSVASTDTFVIMNARDPIIGSFANVPNGGRLDTTDGVGSFLVTYWTGPFPDGYRVELSDFQPASGPGLLSQTISFDPIPDKMLGDGPFSISASASSGLPVSFSIVSGPATISGNTITLTGTGTVVVRATQAGNATYAPAPDVERSFTVSGPGLLSQTISFDPIPNKMLGDGPFSISANASSGLPVSFSIVSGPATISGNTITLTGTGTVVVRATQAGNTTYAPAPDVERSFTVSGPALLSQTISFDPIPNKMLGDGPFSVSANASSGLPVSFSIVSGPASISGNTITLTGTGTVVVRATQAGNATYAPAPDLERSFSVSGPALLSQTISFDPIPDKTQGEGPFSISASASSGLPVSFSIVSGPASISGNTITLTGTGTVVVRATQAGNATYAPAPEVERSFAANLVTPPRLASIGSLVVRENSIVGPTALDFADRGSLREDFQVTASSSNTSLVPDQSILFSGTGYERKMVILPTANQSGTATIAVRVSDGLVAGTLDVVVTVLALNERAPVKGDFNGDGKADILFQDNDGFLGAWLMNGAKMESASLLDPANARSWRVCGTADFDRNDKPDILFQHADGTLAVWFMDGPKMVSATLLNPATSGQAWQAVGIGDFNRDGKPDIVFQHSDGTLACWLMDGVDLAQPSYFEPGHPGDSRWRVAGSGDFDTDGNDDLVFQHSDGTIAIWFLDGLKLSRPTLTTPSNSGGSIWRLAGVSDQDGDGNPDLIFQSTGDGSLAVWFMNGSSLIQPLLLDPPNAGGTWTLVAPR